MTLPTGNLFTALPAGLAHEQIDDLWVQPGLRVERIVSHGQATPAGEWYDQAWDEWVLVVLGAARLRIEGRDDPIELRPGSWVLLPAHCRHRVEWTMPGGPTVWLAIHVGEGA